MTLVHIKSPELTLDQKKRIGERIISAFFGEGFEAGSVVVLFERAVADLYVDGGLLFEAQGRAISAPLPAVVLQAPAALPVPLPAPVLAAEPPDFRNKPRRSRLELLELKAELVVALQAKGALSSFQAQLDLGLKACDWAPATLRRFFSELEEAGVIEKQGQKRGTRYVWKGISTQLGTAAAMPLLVKHPEGALDF